MRSIRLAPFAALLASPFIVTGASAQVTASSAAKPDPATAALEDGEGRLVAQKLADELLKSFVYQDQADAYAAMLRANATAGKYDKGNRKALAELLTDDMQAVHKDGHLHVELAPENDGPDAPGARSGPPKGMPPLIQSARTIAPGIGYIRFTAFTGRDEEMAGVRKWLAENRDDKVLIFDLRNHHGGGLAEQDAIFSYLFAKPTPLVKMAISKAVYDEHGMPFQKTASLTFKPQGDKMVATHKAIPAEATPLRKAKVYLLISNKTASAAEHFSLAMKSTGRGTLIGEATAGANHFGGPAPLNEHFVVWMPVGRTYDVKTGKDWEGAGIAPDIAVDPKQALIVALEKAGLSHAEAIKLDAEEIPAEPIHSDKLRAR